MPPYTGPAAPLQVNFNNHLPIDLVARQVTQVDPMQYSGVQKIFPRNGSSPSNMNTYVGTAFGLELSTLGAVVCVIREIEEVENAAWLVFYKSLLAPNNIGRPQIFSLESSELPPSFQSVLVGLSNPFKAADTDTSILLSNTQQWIPSDDPIVLDAGDYAERKVTKELGTVEATSAMQEFSSTIGSEVSAGWGPISAKISASFTATSRTTQSFTVSELTRTEDVRKFAAEPDSRTGWYFFKFQQVVSVLDANTLQPLQTLTQELGRTTAKVIWSDTGPHPADAADGEVGSTTRLIEWDDSDLTLA